MADLTLQPPPTAEPAVLLVDTDLGRIVTSEKKKTCVHGRRLLATSMSGDRKAASQGLCRTCEWETPKLVLKGTGRYQVALIDLQTGHPVTRSEVPA